MIRAVIASFHITHLVLHRVIAMLWRPDAQKNLKTVTWVAA